MLARERNAQVPRPGAAALSHVVYVECMARNIHRSDTPQPSPLSRGGANRRDARHQVRADSIQARRWLGQQFSNSGSLKPQAVPLRRIGAEISETHGASLGMAVDP